MAQREAVSGNNKKVEALHGCEVPQHSDVGSICGTTRIVDAEGNAHQSTQKRVGGRIRMLCYDHRDVSPEVFDDSEFSDTI